MHCLFPLQPTSTDASASVPAGPVGASPGGQHDGAPTQLATAVCSSSRIPAREGSSGSVVALAPHADCREKPEASLPLETS